MRRELIPSLVSEFRCWRRAVRMSCVFFMLLLTCALQARFYAIERDPEGVLTLISRSHYYPSRLLNPTFALSLLLQTLKSVYLPCICSSGCVLARVPVF